MKPDWTIQSEIKKRVELEDLYKWGNEPFVDGTRMQETPAQLSASAKISKGMKNLYHGLRYCLNEIRP